MTNGVAYGWTRALIQGWGLYFNQRLFEEAGLDPQLPFDLQMAGEWILTRDIDNDGIIDVWAMATFSSDILPRAVRSNNAKFIGIDENGFFYNGTTTPEFLEALVFVNSLDELGFLMPQPEGSEWNWFNQAWLNGQVAMRTAANFEAAGFLANLGDDFGFATFPIGPNATTPLNAHHANVLAVPATFSPDEVDDIMFLFQLWNRPLPEFDDPDGWMLGAYLNHAHPRSVDETMALFMRNPDILQFTTTLYIPGLHGNAGVGTDFAWRMWQEGSDPAVIVEEAQQKWDTLIAEANANRPQPEVCPVCGR
jgi:hypothetical protein